MALGAEMSAIGGSVYLGRHAVVEGDVTSMGGTIEREPGAEIHGATSEVGILPFGPYGDRWLTSPDGRTLAVMRSENEVQLWDVPPRKPLAWFLAGAVLLALPPALLTRWRVRRLRRAATTGGS